MPASWIRRSFDGVGLTQYPPGPHLPAVQAHLVGCALLCLDVSGSMSGEPLEAAKKGGARFLAEAQEAHYRIGLVLWHHDIEESVPVGARSSRTTGVLRRAAASGGNDLTVTLRHAVAELGPLTGDRVVCIFGDGDVGPRRTECVELVRQARALGIRFVVRGLGDAATRALAAVLTPDEESDDQLVRDVDDLPRGIASMARHLRRR